MLNIDKMEVFKSAGPLREINYVATLQIGAGVVFDAMALRSMASPPDSMIKEDLAKQIWHGVYGDLHEPLMEAQLVAVQYLPNYSLADLFTSKIGKVHRLLQCPEVWKPKQ